MSNNYHALVLVWMGNNLPDYVVEQLVSVLSKNNVTIPELTVAKYFDNQSIAKTLIANTQLVATVDDTVLEAPAVDQEEAVKNAIIYIGKRFENALKTSYIQFTIELIDAVEKEKNTVSFNLLNKSELLTAIELLATTQWKVPRTFTKRYHFTENVVDVIREVYTKSFS